jgi:two-component system, response regulator
MTKRHLRVLFGTRVKAERNQLGISQEELADRAGLHRTYISDIERGARNISLESIEKLAKALKISISALFADATSSGAGDAGLAEKIVDILLVEDNRNDIEMTLHAFRRANVANRVHVVRDGAAALDFVFGAGEYAHRAAHGRPQLILLDLNLPKLNGLEVLRRIRANAQTRRIPVIVLTVSQRGSDMEECRRLGVENYIVKPVNFQNLSSVTPQLRLEWALLQPIPTNDD